jgi:hypothetical protein
VASYRELPSGRYQAAVLMDDGKRVTNTLDTLGAAQAWAMGLEDERDQARRLERAYNQDHRTTMAIETLRLAAKENRLTRKQRAALAEIIGGEQI